MYGLLYKWIMNAVVARTSPTPQSKQKHPISRIKTQKTSFSLLFNHLISTVLDSITFKPTSSRLAWKHTFPGFTLTNNQYFSISLSQGPKKHRRPWFTFFHTSFIEHYKPSVNRPESYDFSYLYIYALLKVKGEAGWKISREAYRISFEKKKRGRCTIQDSSAVTLWLNLFFSFYQVHLQIWNETRNCLIHWQLWEIICSLCFFFVRT